MDAESLPQKRAKRRCNVAQTMPNTLCEQRALRKLRDVVLRVRKIVSRIASCAAQRTLCIAPRHRIARRVLDLALEKHSQNPNIPSIRNSLSDNTLR
jgi:hypothetical protein